jgi:hypothetical protein
MNNNKNEKYENDSYNSNQIYHGQSSNYSPTYVSNS